MVCGCGWCVGTQIAMVVVVVVVHVGPMVVCVHVEEGTWGGLSGGMKTGWCTVAATLYLIKCCAHLEM